MIELLAAILAEALFAAVAFVAFLVTELRWLKRNDNQWYTPEREQR